MLEGKWARKFPLMIKGMTTLIPYAEWVALSLLVLGIGLWWWANRREHSLAVGIGKVGVTIGLTLGMAALVGALMSQENYSRLFVPLLAVVYALVLAVHWAPGLGTLLARPLTDALDGGSLPPEPRPYYSVALAHRQHGDFQQAVAHIREQLERFPHDVEGQLLLAAIQAENLLDLPAAEQTIEQLCAQPGLPPAVVAAARQQLADWHLKWGQDVEAARRALQAIVDQFPETDVARTAAERQAHLDSTAKQLRWRAATRWEVRPGRADLGLRPGEGPVVPGLESATDAIEECRRQLAAHPQDTEARERLAVLYAQQLQRLDLAREQFEWLVRHHLDAPQKVAHWLHRLADLQVQAGESQETVRGTLQSIVELYPDLAVAETARARLARLPLEIRGRQRRPAVALGQYETNLGVRRGRPTGPV